MRQENYLIALFNKDLLDLRLPLPDVVKTLLGLLGAYQETKQGTILTRALEWNLRFCLMSYLFDRSGRVRKVFLKDRNKDVLIKGCVLSTCLSHVRLISKTVVYNAASSSWVASTQYSCPSSYLICSSIRSSDISRYVLRGISLWIWLMLG